MLITPEKTTFTDIRFEVDTAAEIPKPDFRDL